MSEETPSSSEGGVFAFRRTAAEDILVVGDEPDKLGGQLVGRGGGVGLQPAVHQGQKAADEIVAVEILVGCGDLGEPVFQQAPEGPDVFPPEQILGRGVPGVKEEVGVPCLFFRKYLKTRRRACWKSW